MTKRRSRKKISIFKKQWIHYTSIGNKDTVHSVNIFMLYCTVEKTIVEKNSSACFTFLSTKGRNSAEHQKLDSDEKHNSAQKRYFRKGLCIVWINSNLTWLSIGRQIHREVIISWKFGALFIKVYHAILCTV